MTNNTAVVHETFRPDVGIDAHSMFRAMSMTIFIHDYAYPITKIPLFIGYTEKPKDPVPLQMYSIFTLECVRGMKDEELGRMVREVLLKIDSEKQKIEKR